MDPPNEDGPDASSLKPVSSLRARFENMSKPAADTLSPLPSPYSTVPSRPLSPAPKPDRLRDPNTSATTTVSSDRLSFVPPPKQKLRETSGSALGSALGNTLGSTLSDSPTISRPASRLGPPPPLSPRPIPPPSLLVQPPHSPPKGRASNIAPGAEPSSSFLNPDTLAKSPLPPASPFVSPRLPPIPSRPRTPSPAPHTPILDTSHSPRLPSSQPPSPPPPRRSTELKRERDPHKEQPLRVGPPPPVSRTDKKPKIPSQHHIHGRPPSPRMPSTASAVGPFAGAVTPTRPKSTSAEKLSPFSTPPSSTESPNEEQPPSLPARPRSQIHLAEPMPPSLRPKTGSPAAEDAPPPLPSRPQIVVEPNTPTGVLQHIPATTRLPPRPHRTGADPSDMNGGSSNSVRNGAQPPPTKRIASNPVTAGQQQQQQQQQHQKFPPPPMRGQHSRSMTLDRASGKLPDMRQSTISLSTGTSSATMTPIEGSSNAGSTRGLGSSYSSGGGSGGGGGGFGSFGSSETLVPASSSALSKASDALPSPSLSFPDLTNVNRRPPYVKQGVAEISTKYDCRLFDICGQRIVTTGNLTRVWSLVDGELLMSLSHGENIKATAVAFKPGAHVDDEGLRVWIGNNGGDLMEANIGTQSLVATKPNVHNRHEVIKIYRHYNELWTLCDGGTLYVWGPTDDDNVPSLAGPPHQLFRLPRGHTFSMVVGDELWHATGKEIRVFLPSLDGKATFQVLMRALYCEAAGEVSAGTVLLSDPDKVFFGHTDGKVSLYSRTDYTCVGLISLGSYKINTLASAGPYVWAGYNTGRVSVYDAATTPWSVKKDWAAHEQPVVKLVADRSSAYRLGQVQVVSLGADNMLRIWDGLLQEDWLEEHMQARDTSYCRFETIRAFVMTWNAGASTPGSLRYAEDDARFMQTMLQGSGSPDLLVFGFQELVDLEDKKATAKRILKVKSSKAKEGSEQERMSHQYRDWRDFLVRSLDDYMGGELYHLLQTVHMVGLFTCVFVKADLRNRIRSVATAEVKRGMGGLHGNKGAVMVRFVLDDTSVCFVNCHLAAGQTQAAHRHHDIAAILESAGLPAERDVAARIDTFTGGGDGSMILDHELCVLNGDLNYRIDTMSRDTVVGAVRAGNLAKLLERDQLLVARRRNAGFRLRVFEELPIQFAPTYKYDVGTDAYDSSEKRRSPAWCDRLLFRGGRSSRVQQLDYRRHEVRVSDHRPVSGRFLLTVKQIAARQRAVVWMECQQEWEDYKAGEVDEEKFYYLTHIIGYDKTTSRDLMRSRIPRRTHRSPSRATDR